MLSCDVCQFAKHVRASYPVSNTRANEVFSLIHSDVWGPLGINTRCDFEYFITFIDDYSRSTFVYLLKDHSKVPHVIETFILHVQTQYGSSVKTFRSDNAREYVCQAVEDFFRKREIVHETSCSYAPPQNGVAERKNRQLLNVTRALLFQRNLPKQYWGDAVLTSAYLINRMPSRVLNGQTPHSMLPGSRPPFLLPPRVFGCVCFIHDHSPYVKKLDPRSIKGVFVGYSPTQKGYKCLDPTTGRVYVTKDVTFLEHVSYFCENTLQGEKSMSREEYSLNQEIQFTDFLDYKQEESPQAVEVLEHERNEECSTGTKEECNRLFGQVYSRRRVCTDKVIDGENSALNLNPTSSLNAIEFAYACLNSLSQPQTAKESSYAPEDRLLRVILGIQVSTAKETCLKFLYTGALSLI
ncbi:retrovirus-related Pol polyprotein from transposon TNT 1-94 isoform X1 [Nymphaea colorata]|uniref:retrovirus-related Pol polyprotein from transposon TNT 1-94 isoform X1 n=1 Tax=Nymphaea colorata TaxID=210225 RepID=UPI00214E671D|nr:retrovirus-related Pol polyprotein from transposon TNT 1-94 isoform X1 [Nymphaea colorata]XP_049931296.1 retrovirus-related Pol polyprotein from transposon TNT 1-94 isoform X1 [Nymphaea colorata]